MTRRLLSWLDRRIDARIARADGGLSRGAERRIALRHRIEVLEREVTKLKGSGARSGPPDAPSSDRAVADIRADSAAYGATPWPRDPTEAWASAYVARVLVECGRGPQAVTDLQAEYAGRGEDARRALFLALANEVAGSAIVSAAISQNAEG